MERSAHDENGTVSERVVSTVADLTGSDPVALEPLYDVVDPEALDDLFDASGSDLATGRVSFTYCDCDVTVSADGSVSVSAPERDRSKPER